MLLDDFFKALPAPRGVSIDSRTLTPGDLFFAIIGERFDGHHFVRTAVEKGASAVVVSRPLSFETAVPIFRVPDTVHALQALATQWRSRFQLPVIGVTGSCGKTTVKMMLSAILSQMGSCCTTFGNLNNMLGVPLSVLGLENKHQYAVFELGASTVGEIAFLSSIAQPTFSVVTCVAPAHLESFGSIERIAAAKGEIYEALPETGVAVIPISEPFRPLWEAQKGAARVFYFGMETEKADMWAKEIVLAPLSSRFRLVTRQEEKEIHLNIAGKHNVFNALAASAAAYVAGASLEAIERGLHTVRAEKGRLQVFSGFNGTRIIDDSYNANPGSVHAALEVLTQFEGERVLVLGDMLELGLTERALHQDLGRQAKALGIERLMVIGDLAQSAAEAFGARSQVFETKEALIHAVRNTAHQQMTLLVKGSRASGMQTIVQALTEEVH